MRIRPSIKLTAYMRAASAAMPGWRRIASALWLSCTLLGPCARVESACTSDFVVLPVADVPQCSLVSWRHITKAGGTTMRVAFERLSLETAGAWMHVSRQERLTGTTSRCVNYASKQLHRLALSYFAACAKGGAVNSPGVSVEYHVPSDGVMAWAADALEVRSLLASLAPAGSPARARATFVVVLRNPISWLQSEWESPAVGSDLKARGTLSSWMRDRADMQCRELALLSGFERPLSEGGRRVRGGMGIPLLRDGANRTGRPAEATIAAVTGRKQGWAALCERWADDPPPPSAELADEALLSAKPVSALASVAPAGVSAPHAAALAGLLAQFDVVGVTERMQHTLGAVCAAAGLSTCPLNVRRAHHGPVQQCRERWSAGCKNSLRANKRWLIQWTAARRREALNATRADRALHAAAERALDEQLRARWPHVRAAVDAGRAESDARASEACGLAYGLRQRVLPPPRGKPKKSSAPSPPAARGRSLRRAVRLRQRARALTRHRRRRLLEPLPPAAGKADGAHANATGPRALPTTAVLGFVRAGCCWFRHPLGRDGRPYNPRRSVGRAYDQYASTLPCLTGQDVAAMNGTGHQQGIGLEASLQQAGIGHAPSSAQQGHAQADAHRQGLPHGPGATPLPADAVIDIDRHRDSVRAGSATLPRGSVQHGVIRTLGLVPARRDMMMTSYDDDDD